MVVTRIVAKTKTFFSKRFLAGVLGASLGIMGLGFATNALGQDSPYPTSSTNPISQGRLGRLGIGYSNQFVHGISALSVKLQKSQSFAVGALLGAKIGDTNGGLGAGLKFYKIMFAEPNLNFYSSLMAGLLKEKKGGVTNSGYQFDFTLGSEFSFQGLKSLGFSFEFGVSAYKLQDNLIIQTLGLNMITAALHFYI